ncbi:MAG: hypothetical protein K9G61_10810 [Bacteroidales bacterium]|nr:hypothetical protein [Bacteroidales bacterium]
MNNQAPQLFARRFSTLLTSAVKQRIHLTESGKGKRNTAFMQTCISRLLPYTQMKLTEKGAALILIKNMYYIRAIIPSKNVNQLANLEALHTAAQLFTSNNFSHANL